MIEIWKDIKGYEGIYKVSNFGRVKSFPRNGTVNKEYILKPVVTKKGYCVLTLSKNNEFKKYLVHRLVAESFLENYDNLSQVNHIDGNKQNNNAKNLEWCSCQDNITHSIIKGLKPDDKGVKSCRSKFSEKDISYIRENYIKRDKLYGCTPLAKKFGVAKSTISYIVNNKTYIPV